MTEAVEFEILIDGKPAKKSLDEIKKELDVLEKKDKQVATTMKADWRAIGLGIAAAGAAMVTVARNALDLEKATFGLTEQTKDYIRQASELHGLSQEMIAGFVQTGKAAGMSGDEIEKMIDQAVALKRAYPHESVETFVDNLTMLNRTGEAQGFIVDVLEAKYGTLDLKSLTLAQKMAAVEEATAGVNEELRKINGAKVDRAYQKIANSATGLGTALTKMLSDTNILGFFDDVVIQAKKMVQYFGIGLNSIGAGFVYMKATAQKAISDILWSMKDIPGIGDAIREKALAMNTEYNVTIDRFNQITKGIKEQVKETENLAKAQEKASITGIAGKEKPKTQLEIENETKATKTIIDEKNKRIQAEQRAMQEIERVQKSFNDSYLRSVLDAKQYEIVQLDEKYNEYAKHIEDKAKLDEWYNNEVERILKEDEQATDEYKKLKEETFDALTDQFIKFAQTGKFSVKDMANSIIADLLRIQVQKTIVGALSGGSGGIGSFFGFHTGVSEVKHTGGAIGGGANIPSYHTGLRTDERYAKLQVGEAVVNRAGASNNKDAINAINRGETVKMGGSGDAISANVSLTINAIDTQSGTQFLLSNFKTIEDGVTQSILNGKSVAKAIKTIG